MEYRLATNRESPVARALFHNLKRALTSSGLISSAEVAVRLSSKKKGGSSVLGAGLGIAFSTSTFRATRFGRTGTKSNDIASVSEREVVDGTATESREIGAKAVAEAAKATRESAEDANFILDRLLF